MSRHFTVEEANAALNEIRPLVEEIMRIHQVVITRQPEAWPAIERAAGNGGNRAASELVPEFERLRRLVHRVQDEGAILKDLGTGLLDFPALRDGREVYLCWKYGEESILFWHDIDTGYMGRQPI